MFSFDDGSIHEDVYLVVDDKERYKMQRVVKTSVYVVDYSSLQQIALSQPKKYQIQVDGRLLEACKPGNRAERHVMQHQSSNTSYLLVKSRTTSRPKQLIYMIPGNPGLSEFYFDFAESLASHLPQCLIVVVSYEGYDVYDVNASLQPTIIGLKEQIQHKINFLDYILALNPSVKEVALLGHSVGSWVSQRVAVRHPLVKFVGLLTPTIHGIALSDQGKRFSKLTHYIKPYYVYLLLALIVTFVPYGRSILRTIAILVHQGLRSEVSDCIQALITCPTVVYQILGMALEEMRDISVEIEPKGIEGFWDSKQIYILFAEKDHWVSESSRSKILEHAQTRTNVETDIVSIPHAFCLKNSEIVGRLVASQIEKQFLS